jgi:uncharacterized protein (TIGR03083 family)
LLSPLDQYRSQAGCDEAWKVKWCPVAGRRTKKRGESELKKAEEAVEDFAAEVENRLMLGGEVATATTSPEVNLVAGLGTALLDSPGSPGAGGYDLAFDPKKTDPFPAYDAEIHRLRRYLRRLQPAGWRTASHCAGWSVKDVVSHLCGDEEYNQACLDGTLDKLDYSGGLDATNERGVRRRRNLPYSTVLKEWEMRQAKVRQAWGRLGLEAKIDTAGAGQYSLRLQIWHLAREYAIHSDDIRVPVPGSDRGERNRWRAGFGVFAAREEGEKLRVRFSDDAAIVRARNRQEEMDLETFIAFLANRPQHLTDPQRRRQLARLGARG